jgi:hypothetical protein
MYRSRLCAVAISVALVSCSSITGSHDRRVIGTIQEGLNSAIDAPASVSAGQSFNVTVTTVGNSCVSAAGAEFAVHDLVAVITPYDKIREEGTCLDYRAPYPRTVQIRFARAGSAVIRVNGIGDTSRNEVTVERAVTVTP